MTKREHEIDLPEKPIVPGCALIRHIGEGASGDVWICKNTATKKILAVKIIWNSTREERVWFKKEQAGLTEYEKIEPKPDMLLDIRHVQIADDGRFLYYTMPLADGVSGVKPSSKRYQPLTLDCRLKKEGMLGFRESTEIACRVAEALKTFHSVGLIHRDVKPANIIFIRGKAVLADIGLVTDASGDVSNAGTPLYREDGKKPSVRGDVYALGKVLYQMINGKDPRDFPSPGSRANDKDSHLFPKLNHICIRACGKDDRYLNAGQMLEALSDVLSDCEKPAVDSIWSKLGWPSMTPKENAGKNKLQTKPASREDVTAKGASSKAPKKLRALPPPVDTRNHPAINLMEMTDPIWSYQQGPESFIWEKCGGRLYKMMAPYTFIEGQSVLNEKELAKVRVAVFLPSNYRPDTPLVYAVANFGEDFSSNACLVPIALNCGYGLVTIDTPLTGICKFGADLVDGTAVNIDTDFAAAARSVELKCGINSVNLRFVFNMQRFTARNLLLTKTFIEKTFGIRPRKTVLTGSSLGVLTAGFAFTTIGVGDVLIGFNGSPVLLDGVVEQILPTIPAWWHMLLSTVSAIDDSLVKQLNPATYAVTVKPPREVHLLCGIKDKLLPSDKIEIALSQYMLLEENENQGFQFAEAGRNSWPHALQRTLNSGKSVIWFDGGHDLSGWRGDLRFMFLETKLRMLFSKN